MSDALRNYLYDLGYELKQDALDARQERNSEPMPEGNLQPSNLPGSVCRPDQTFKSVANPFPGRRIFFIRLPNRSPARRGPQLGLETAFWSPELSKFRPKPLAGTVAARNSSAKRFSSRLVFQNPASNRLAAD